jgi:hypothetical protein
VKRLSYFVGDCRDPRSVRMCVALETISFGGETTKNLDRRDVMLIDSFYYRHECRVTN